MVARTKNGRFAKASEVKRRESVAEVQKKKKKSVKSQPIVEAGRRIMDLTVLANDMWCSICEHPLHFQYLEKEVRRGLASIFHFRCPKCLEVTQVCSSKTVKSGDNGYPVYSVNSKAALSCVDSGCGHEQFNHILTTLNIPPVSHHTLKLAEGRIGSVIEKTAKDSCQSALEEEKALTMEHNHGNIECEEDSGEPAECVEIVVQYDFGWNKRGNGHCYNSHSGQGSVIGHQTKKIIAYSSRSSVCAKCAKEHDPKSHDCRKDWAGTAKGMERDTAAKLIAENEDFSRANVRVGVLVGDEDASTRVAVQQKSSHPIAKWIDRNHNIKRFSSKLYNLRGRFRFLSTIVIKYVTSLLAVAIDTNKGNVEGTRKGILQILHHTYGDHQSCGDWCRARNKPEYFFARLPGGKPFSCPNFKKELEKLLNDQANKAHQIAPGGTSQHNESFNHMVATRAPKGRHYAGTAANNIRVSSAVCQKNLGATYIVGVNKAAGLSPGGVTEKYRKIEEQKRRSRDLRQRLLSSKQRRLFLKNQNSSKSTASQRREGLTYVGGMGTTMERAAAAASTTTWLPPSVPLQPQSSFVVMDLETTGFGAQAEIVQIAAKCQAREFARYMLPTKGFNHHASLATGLTVQEGHLMLRGSRVETTPSRIVAGEFITFLKDCAEQVILVGHNIIRFDAPILVLWLKKHGLLEDFCNIIYGFTDTLPLLKQGKVRKQEELARMFLTGPEWTNIIDGAHNAARDVLILNRLLEHQKVESQVLRSSALSARDFFQRQVAARKKKDLLPSLELLRPAVSKSMLGKMASQGVTIEELKEEYKLHGVKGIQVCLGVQVNGKPRVTSSKKIIDKIVQCVCSL